MLAPTTHVSVQIKEARGWYNIIVELIFVIERWNTE